MWCRRKIQICSPRQCRFVRIFGSSLPRSISVDWNKSIKDLSLRRSYHRPLFEKWPFLGKGTPLFDFFSLSKEFPQHVKGRESNHQTRATFYLLQPFRSQSSLSWIQSSTDTDLISFQYSCFVWSIQFLIRLLVGSKWAILGVGIRLTNCLGSIYIVQQLSFSCFLQFWQ